LLAAFLKANKPVLGVCRGFQLINVAFGGSMYQDIPAQHAGYITHDSSASYCGCTHAVNLVAGGALHGLYNVLQGRVNSAHHQGVRDIGAGLKIEARAPDNIVEALTSTQHRFVMAVQWHPEFHHLDAELLPPAPLMQAFLAACRS
jgi:putative glutamine amidotransferase